MPRKLFIGIPIPPVKPPKCASCPFVGIIPEAKRKKGSKKTYRCLALNKAISKRSITIVEEEKKKRDPKHPFHRPCDRYYDAFLQLPGRVMNIPISNYNESRVPYIQLQAIPIDFGNMNEQIDFGDEEDKNSASEGEDAPQCDNK